MSVLRRVGITAVAVLTVPAVALLAPSVAHAETGGPGGTFVDDNGSPHEGYIEAVSGAGITTGCTAGRRTYCPGTTVSRGQMASFLARALDLPAASRDHFVDDAGTAHEDNINRVADAGITLGDASGQYRPNAPVLRGQMASFLVRAFELGASTANRFTDDDGTPHERNVDAVADAGITTGCGGTRFCPGQPVTRAQMATFLGRALGLPQQTPPPVVTFGPGQKRVGADVPAGTYRSSHDSDFCYWERLSGFGGSLDEINANSISTGRTLVTIDPSDAGFDSDDCGTWTNDLGPITASPTSPFGRGTFQVGPEVAPGTWRSSGPAPDDSCYWERLSGFGGGIDDIIANDNQDVGPVTVTIAPGDVGFASSRCGTWTKVG